jgi:hypothetical protein
MDIQPYIEIDKTGIQVTRIFGEDTIVDELVWHRDREDRVIEVLENSDWQFQLDNKLPTELTQGRMLYIPKNTYHRVIKGRGILKVRITKYELDIQR